MVMVVTAMLAIAAYALIAASSDMKDAAGAQVKIGALSKAAADMELAWFQAMGADALAATGEAPDESQGFYDGAINLYNSSKVVLSAAGIEQIDVALAASDQGLAGMNAAFAETMRIAATGNVVAATDNHMDNTVVLYNTVEPAVKGLGQVAQAADARLEARMIAGASDLNLAGWISVFIGVIGAMFAGWSGWSIYRRESDAAKMAAVDEPASMDKAA